MQTFEQQEIDLGGGEHVVARFFAPTGPARGALLLAPAMAVPQTYYTAFAEWLARQGLLVATFDYRGIGLSRRGHLRELDADVIGWATRDCAAMVDAVGARAPGLPLYWLGHSLGGQILPFVPNNDKVDKVLTIATGSGYWRENTASLKRTVWSMWYFFVPLAVPLCGYFPGKRLGMVGDLPRGVIEQWRRWCLHRDYAVGVEGATARARYEAIRQPIVSLSFTDDEYMTARSIAAIHDSYSNAPRDMRRIAPEQIGVRRIGHFGFFKPAFEQSLWQAHLLPELRLDTAAAGRAYSPIQ